jgi:hypothetical protein
MKVGNENESWKWKVESFLLTICLQFVNKLSRVMFKGNYTFATAITNKRKFNVIAIQLLNTTFKHS